MLRKMLAVLLAVVMTAAVLPVMAEDAHLFGDTKGHWAQTAVETWAEKGLVNGFEGDFRPDDPICRAEVMVLADRLMGYIAADSNIFADLGETWYTDAVLKCTHKGIVQGYDNKVFPEKAITRQEAVVILSRMIELDAVDSDTGYNDDKGIADWAKGYVQAFGELGYVQGRPGNVFDPEASITRAEFVTIIDQMFAGWINQAGRVTGDFDGNVVVNAAGVTLENMTIAGNLILAEGIGEGEAYLNNVHVLGDVMVYGGGESSVYLDSVTVDGSLFVAKEGGSIRIVASGDTKISVTQLADGAVLVEQALTGGGFQSVVIPAGDVVGASFQIEGSLAHLSIGMAGADVTLADGSLIGSMSVNAPDVEIAALGQVTTLSVAEGVVGTIVDGDPVDGGSIVDIGIPAAVPNSGGGSSSGGSTGSTNNAPTLVNPIGDQSGQVGLAFDLAIPSDTFNDADGDTLTYSVNQTPDGIVFAGRVFSGTPTVDGTLAVTVTADDGNGGTAQDTFNITISTAAVNNPPVMLSPLPSLNGRVGEFLNIQLDTGNFMDPDGDSLSFAINQAPPGLTYMTDTFVGTPIAAGTTSINVRVGDGNGGAIYAPFDFIIEEAHVNTAPVVINPIPDQSGTLGQMFAFTIPSDAFFDADGDTMTYPVDQVPTGLTYMVDTFSGVPTVVGDTRVTVTADDGHGGSTSDSFVISIADVPDVTSPAAVSFVPADNEAMADIDADLEIQFDEMVVTNSGALVIRDVSSNVIVETYTTSSSALVINGDLVTIDRTEVFEKQTDYYVEIDSGMFVDMAGNACIGISGDSDWNFTTEPERAPMVIAGQENQSGYATPNGSRYEGMMSEWFQDLDSPATDLYYSLVSATDLTASEDAVSGVSLWRDSSTGDARISYTPTPEQAGHVVELVVMADDGVNDSLSNVTVTVNIDPAAVPMAGDGSDAAPFIIIKIEDLCKVGTEDASQDGKFYGMDAHYRLAADLDFESDSSYYEPSVRDILDLDEDGNVDELLKTVVTSGTGFRPIGNGSGRFYGSFDGDGFSINNLYISGNDRGPGDGANYLGLFGQVGRSGSITVIKGLTLVDPVVKGKNGAGPLASMIFYETSVSDCHVKGGSTLISGNYAGGLIAKIIHANMANCSVTDHMVGGTLTSGFAFGGLVGGYDSSGDVMRMDRCYAYDVTVSGNNRVGGLIGETGMESTTKYYMADCFARVSLDGGASGVAGLVGNTGYRDILMEQSYAIDMGTEVRGSWYNGLSSSGILRNCISMIGGFKSNINQTYYDDMLNRLTTDTALVSGSYANGGMTFERDNGTAIPVSLQVGINKKDGANLTLAEFKSELFYTADGDWDSSSAWDFTNTWMMTEIGPWLRWAASEIPEEGIAPQMEGLGTEVSPFIIMSVEDLCVVGRGAIGDGNDYSMSASYRLGRDLDFDADASYDDPTGLDVLDSDNDGITNENLKRNISEPTGSYISYGFRPIGDGAAPFAGTFDGNGFSLHNLYINQGHFSGNPEPHSNGLFGIVDGDSGVAVIENLTLIGPELTAQDALGPFVGQGLNASIENCHTVNGMITAVHSARDVGGIIGKATNMDIVRCSVKDTNITAGGSNVGGIVGAINNSEPHRMLEASVERTVLEGGGRVGGLAGACTRYQWVMDYLIKDCYVQVSMTSGNEVGGISGFGLDAIVVNCVVEDNGSLHVGHNFDGLMPGGIFRNNVVHMTGFQVADMSVFQRNIHRVSNDSMNDGQIYGCYVPGDMSLQWADGSPLNQLWSDGRFLPLAEHLGHDNKDGEVVHDAMFYDPGFYMNPDPTVWDPMYMWDFGGVWMMTPDGPRLAYTLLP